MKAPVGLLSGRAVCVSRWKGFTLTSSAERSKRLFTGGVVTESSICSAAFCESAALRETNPLRLTAFASSPKGGAFGYLAVSTDKAPPFGGAGAIAPERAGTRAREGLLPLFAKKFTGSDKAGRSKPKIRTNACFTALKTYKSAKKFFLFLLCLFGGLRLLCGQNLLL